MTPATHRAFAAVLTLTCSAIAIPSAHAETPVYRYKAAVVGAGGGTQNPGGELPGTEEPNPGPNEPTPGEEQPSTGEPSVVFQPTGNDDLAFDAGYDRGGFRVTKASGVVIPAFGADNPVAVYCVTASGGWGNYQSYAGLWPVEEQSWYGGADMAQPSQLDREMWFENEDEGIPAVYPYRGSNFEYPNNMFESFGVTWRLPTHTFCVRQGIDIDALEAASGGRPTVLNLELVVKDYPNSAVTTGDYDQWLPNYSHVRQDYEDGGDAATITHKFSMTIRAR